MSFLYLLMYVYVIRKEIRALCYLSIRYKVKSENHFEWSVEIPLIALSLRYWPLHRQSFFSNRCYSLSETKVVEVFFVSDMELVIVTWKYDLLFHCNHPWCNRIGLSGYSCVYVSNCITKSPYLLDGLSCLPLCHQSLISKYCEMLNSLLWRYK